MSESEDIGTGDAAQDGREGVDDLTEDEFDVGWSAGQPVLVVGYEARAQLRGRVEEYYTLQVSDARAIHASAGPSGGAVQRWVTNEYAGLVSTA